MNIWPTEVLDLDLLDISEENPNEMSDDEFSLLVEEIAENGWTVPIQVIGPSPDGRYRIYGGHHRKKAAIVLGFSAVPCIVVDPESMDDDMRQIQLVKQNILHGKLNPEKFTKLYNDLAKKYDTSLLQHMLAFTKADAFNKVYLDAKKGLPPDMQDKLDDMRDELKTVDDLSLVLNRLFTEYGDTVKFHYMFFSYGGREHVMVQLSSVNSWHRVKSFLAWCSDNKLMADIEILKRMDAPQVISTGGLSYSPMEPDLAEIMGS